MHKTRHTRYQAAILRGSEILLIKHREHADGRSYWVLPGGGMEAGEPELDAAAVYAIVEVAWFGLSDETTWNDIILNDPIVAPLLRRIRAALKKMNVNPAENDYG